MSIVYEFKLTDAGRAAAFNAEDNGVDLLLTHVGFGAGFKLPDGTETALINEITRSAIGSGSRITPDQVRVSALWSDDTAEFPIREIGIYSGAVLFGYFSRADAKPIANKDLGVDFVFYYDWKLVEIPANIVTVVVDPDSSTAMGALAQHENDPIPHPQYLLRSEVAQDASRLTWVGVAGGSANALVLTVPLETNFKSYKEGQSLSFIAAVNNNDAVTMRVGELDIRSIRKNGTQVLDANDIIAGVIYRVTFDGTYWQLSGGIGGGSGSDGGDIFETTPFVATAGQTVFPMVYSPGTIIVALKGSTLAPSKYTATNGTSITLQTGAAAGDDLLVFSFRATSAASVYTKAETYSKPEITNLIASALEGASDGIVETTNATTRTITIGDHRSRLRFTSAAVVTIPAGITSELTVELEQAQGGPVTIVAAPGVTINTPQTLVSNRQYAVMTIRRVGTNAYTVSQDLQRLKTGFISNVPGTYDLYLEEGEYSVMVVGGGGGGNGSGSEAQPTTGAGGASGLATKRRITVAKGDRLTVVVGDGGQSSGTSQAQFGGTSQVLRNAVALAAATGGQSAYWDGDLGAIGGRGGSGGGSGGGAYVANGTQYFWCVAGDGGADGADGGAATRTHVGFVIPSYPGGVGGGVGYYSIVNNSIDPAIDHGALAIAQLAGTLATEHDHGLAGKAFNVLSPVASGAGGDGGSGGGGFTRYPKRTGRDGSGFGAGGGALHKGFPGLVSIVRITTTSTQPTNGRKGKNAFKRDADGNVEQWGTVNYGDVGFGGNNDNELFVPLPIPFDFSFSNLQITVIEGRNAKQQPQEVTVAGARKELDGFYIRFGSRVDVLQNVSFDWRALGH